MPRKCRLAQPTRAEAFFAWRKQNINILHLSRLDTPLGSWEVDKFEPWLKEAEVSDECITRRESLAGDASRTAIRASRIRGAVWIAALNTLSRTEELYARRIEQKLHAARGIEARELVSAMRRFLAKHSLDLLAHGAGKNRIFNETQIARYSEAGGDERAKRDSDVIMHHSFALIKALEAFAADRDTLLGLPPADNSDLLGLIFVGAMKRWVDKLFPCDFAAKDAVRFGLAAWRDMRLPFPEDRAANASEEAWMEKKFIAFTKLAPEKKRAIGC